MTDSTNQSDRLFEQVCSKHGVKPEVSQNCYRSNANTSSRTNGMASMTGSANAFRGASRSRNGKTEKEIGILVAIRHMGLRRVPRQIVRCRLIVSEGELSRIAAEKKSSPDEIVRQLWISRALGGLEGPQAVIAKVEALLDQLRQLADETTVPPRGYSVRPTLAAQNHVFSGNGFLSNRRT